VEAIAEAAMPRTMRFVALKTEEQLDVQVLHRVRDRLAGQRTALMNQIRSLLLERGIAASQSRRRLLDALEEVRSGSYSLSGRIQTLLADMEERVRLGSNVL
jgi:transposase